MIVLICLEPLEKYSGSVLINILIYLLFFGLLRLSVLHLLTHGI